MVPINPDRMFAATHDARVLVSTDGGKMDAVRPLR
jgi:hypothetical protein